MICCVRKNGKVEKRLFEFSTVNHFLKDKDGDSAFEVLSCMLIMWLNAEKSSIESFDYEKIDAELVRLDEEIKQKKLRDEAIEAMSSRIVSIIKPVLQDMQYAHCTEAIESMSKKVSNVMQQFKDAGDIADFYVSSSENSETAMSRNEFHVDIGFKLHEGDDFSIVVMDIMPKNDISMQKEDAQ